MNLLRFQLPTGEPCAGEPPAWFGGRGGREPFPTPIEQHYAVLGMTAIVAGGPK